MAKVEEGKKRHTHTLSLSLSLSLSLFFLHALSSPPSLCLVSRLDPCTISSAVLQSPGPSSSFLLEVTCCVSFTCVYQTVILLPSHLSSPVPENVFHTVSFGSLELVRVREREER